LIDFQEVSHPALGPTEPTPHGNDPSGGILWLVERIAAELLEQFRNSADGRPPASQFPRDVRTQPNAHSGCCVSLEEALLRPPLE
jgi:hypothetical protein